MMKTLRGSRRGRRNLQGPLWPAAASRQVSEAEGGQDDVLKVRKGRNASQGYSDVTLPKWRNEATRPALHGAPGGGLPAEADAWGTQGTRGKLRPWGEECIKRFLIKAKVVKMARAAEMY